MPSLRDLLSLWVIAAMLLGGSLSAMGQTPDSGQTIQTSALAELPQADPAVAPGGESGEEKRWLLQTPLVDVPWPQIKMPSLNWKGSGENKGPGPIDRLTQATRKAANSTRATWNRTIDRLKVGPFGSKPGDQPGMFAKFFGDSQPETRPAETVAEAVGQDRPSFR